MEKDESKKFNKISNFKNSTIACPASSWPVGIMYPIKGVAAPDCKLAVA